MRFLSPYTHSAFSFPYGAFQPQALVEAVAARAGAGVCLCDWHGLYAMVRLAKAGQGRKLYTLRGAELVLAQGSSLIIYPGDTAGHASLCRLVTRARLEHQRAQPGVELAWLRENGKLLAIIPGKEALKQGVAWLAVVEPPPPGAGLLPTDADLARWFSASEIKSSWRVADPCTFKLPLGRRYLPADLARRNRINRGPMEARRQAGALAALLGRAA